MPIATTKGQGVKNSEKMREILRKMMACTIKLLTE